MADVRHLQTKYELNERIALHSVVLSLMTIAVAVRLYTRAVIIKKFCLDDCKWPGKNIETQQRS
jgi:hypothetical protein